MLREHRARLKRMATEEIGGWQTLAAFGLDFEEIEKTAAATHEDAAGIGSDNRAGRGTCLSLLK